MIERLNGLVQRADAVDESAGNGLLSGENRAHIGRHLLRVHHHLAQAALGDVAVPEEKACDALLYFFKITCCLGDAEHQTAGSHRMHGHGSRRHDHGEICADGEGNADGVCKEPVPFSPL